jgi:hypothetical protein
MRTNDEIKTIVEVAFRPLRCVAEVWDYDYRLRFRVFDEKGQGVVEVPDLVLRNLRDDTQLRDVPADVRERVIEKGHRLDAWELR